MGVYLILSLKNGAKRKEADNLWACQLINAIGMNMIFNILKRWLGVIAVSVLWISSATAIDVVPDRPGFSTGTYTVQPGIVQVEMGVQNSYGIKVGDPDTFTAPLLNIRTGLSQTTELNLLWDGINLIDGSTQEVSDAMFGLKHQLLVSNQLNLSMLGYLSVQKNEFVPFVALLWDHSLTGKLGFFGTLQLAQSIKENDRTTNFQPAIGMNFTHTGRLNGFVEVYSDRSLDNNSSSTSFNTGLAWLFRKDLQLDVNVGVSLDGSSEHFWGVGVAKAFSF